jgi:hypothetical protein
MYYISKFKYASNSTLQHTMVNSNEAVQYAFFFKVCSCSNTNLTNKYGGISTKERRLKRVGRCELEDNSLSSFARACISKDAES